MLNRFTLTTLTATASASALLLCSCGMWQSVSDTTSSAYQTVFSKQVKVLNVDLTARAALNPDDAGRATSVAVRVYQLKDRQMFDGASYDDLLTRDKAVLGQDLEADTAAVINPGASASLSQLMRPDTQYIGVVGFYRKPGEPGTWKRVIAKKTLSADLPLKLVLMDRQLVASGDASQQ